MMIDDPLAPDYAIEKLSADLALEDGPADASGAWPEKLWELLTAARAPLWALPGKLGGFELDRSTALSRYARIAEGSLTAAFILTQHDAATRRLTASGPTPKAREWLDRIVQGKAFTTVGISQLTTSRRRGPAAVVAAPRHDESGYRIDGVIPWVTGAERADVLVAGAVVEPGGEQILFALPTDRAGVCVEPAFDLAALGASRTSEVTCRNVELHRDEVLFGPIGDAIAASSPSGGTGGLETSALALGQARAALSRLSAESQGRDDLAGAPAALEDEYRGLWRDLMAAAGETPGAPPSGKIRGEANAFVNRATQAYLTARKGTGFLKSEPAQRWARQALFFLVWSCPSPVASAVIRELAGVCGDF